MKTFNEFLKDIQKFKLKTIATNLDVSYRYANGCGAKDSVKFPRTMYGINIESACIIHDIEWTLAKNIEELETANENFDNNMKKIVDQLSAFRLFAMLRRMRIAKYVSAVELYGTLAYAREREFV